jgi:cbb3-type cytochrome oxidase subunit 1
MLAIQPDLIEDGRMDVSWLVVAAYLSIGIALIACGLIFFDIFGRGHYSRWPLYASVVVLGFESMACFFAGSGEWTEQWTEGNVVGINSVHVRYAIELCAIGALTTLASIALLLRRSGWVWWLVIGMQVGILVLAEIEAQVIDANAPGWSDFSRVPLISLVLLFAFRMAQGRLKHPIDRKLTPHLTP